MKATITRRHFMAAAAASVALPATIRSALAAADISALKGSGQVVVCSWGGGYTDSQKKAFFDGFSKATGIEVVTTGVPDLAKLRLMNSMNNMEWDLVDTEGPMMFRGIQEGLLLPVDKELIGKAVPMTDLLPAAVNDYGLGSVAYGWVIGWNKESFAKGGPANWTEFFDKTKFPGRRALYAQPKPVLEIMLMADGVPADKLYPLDVERAFAALKKFGPMIDVWAESTSQFDVMIQNKEVDLAGFSLGRIYNQKKAGFPYDYHFNQGLWEQSWWTIPKLAPNAVNAQKLLAWMMMAEPEQDFVKMFPYGVANKTIYDTIPADLAAVLPTSPQNLKTEVELDPKWWTENVDAITPRWMDWYSSK